jgi:hypothetical protein
MRYSRYLLLTALFLGFTANAWSQPTRLIKPRLDDTDKLSVYADNWFALYINGVLVAVDSIAFMPHNVVTVDVLPEYPMTIAVLAKDNADPKTGLEYGDRIGDGGFILKLGNDIVSNATWRARSFFHGPLRGDRAHPQVRTESLPEAWWSIDFDDSKWDFATVFSPETVRPMAAFNPAQFSGAEFIWTRDLELDNTIIFRTRIENPTWQSRWNTKPDLDVSNTPKS